MGGGGVVHNPIDCAEWPFREEKEDFLLWIGRMSPDKGPHRAIAAAREAGAPLVLAGPVQSGQEQFFADQVEPALGGRRSSTSARPTPSGSAISTCARGRC